MLAGGDTVMTLMTGSGGSGFGTSVIGADSCPRRSTYEASCFSFYMNPALYPTARNFLLVVRSWTSASSGTADIRIQGISSGGTPVNTTCSPMLPIRAGCWSTWPNLSFGSYVHSGFGTAAADYHFETTERPGSSTAPQLILFAIGDNYDTTTNWNLSPDLVFFNHSSFVGGTAEYVGGLPFYATATSTIIAGAASNWGATTPFNFQRNDRGPGFGTDADGDGLGSELETVMKTCDSSTSPPAGGISCSSLRFCNPFPGATYDPARCQASMRDSDQDGYEDNLEVYGHNNGIDELAYMARFGADPARFDAFVEVDTGNTSPDSFEPTCTYDDNGWINQLEAQQIVNTYANATASAFPNRNGVPGVGLHLDLPPRPPGAVVLAELPTENPNFGSWGGGTCLRSPSCTADADCLAYGPCPEAGTCTCGPPATGRPRYCNNHNGLGFAQANSRRWLFRYQLSFPGGGGQAEPCGWSGSAGGAEELGHEIGHLACLGHGGPGAPGFVLGARIFSDTQNDRPTYYSRMNYLYQGYGVSSTFTSGTQPVDPLRIGVVNFSSGTAPTLDPLNVPETCPLGVGRPTRPFDDRSDWRLDPPTPSTCNNVDWDGDGVILPAGQTTSAPLWTTYEQGVRRGKESTRWMAIDSAYEVVTTGTLLRVIRNENTSPSTGARVLTTTRATTFTCNHTPNPSPNDRYPYCDIHGGTAATTILDGGNPISTRAFAATDVVPTSLPSEALLVWRNSSNTLSWGRLPQNVNGALASSGVIAGSTPRTLNDGTGLLALARTTTGAVLVYRNPAGQLVQQTMTWAGSPAVPSWGAPLTLPAGMQTGLQGSPGISDSVTTLTPNGVLLAIQQASTSINLYTRSSTGTWSLTTTMTAPGILRGAPIIEFGPPRQRAGVSGVYLYVTIRTATNGYVQRRHSKFNAIDFGSVAPGDGTNWFIFREPIPSSATTAMALDMRASGQGVRGVHSTVAVDVTCDPSANPPRLCPTGASCTVVGSVRHCVASGVPTGLATQACPQGCAGAIDCGPFVLDPTASYGTGGACPPGLTCESIGGSRPFCSLVGYLPVREIRSPAVDGFTPGLHEDFNEWSTMRHGFCAPTRDMRSSSFTPSAYQNPVPGYPARETCSLMPAF